MNMCKLRRRCVIFPCRSWLCAKWQVVARPSAMPEHTCVSSGRRLGASWSSLFTAMACMPRLLSAVLGLAESQKRGGVANTLRDRHDASKGGWRAGSRHMLHGQPHQTSQQCAVQQRHPRRTSWSADTCKGAAQCEWLFCVLATCTHDVRTSARCQEHLVRAVGSRTSAGCSACGPQWCLATLRRRVRLWTHAMGRDRLGPNCSRGGVGTAQKLRCPGKGPAVCPQVRGWQQRTTASPPLSAGPATPATHRLCCMRAGKGLGGPMRVCPSHPRAPCSRPHASVVGCGHNAVLLCTSIHLTAHASALPQDVLHLAGCGRLFRLFARNLGSVPHADCDICTVHVLPPLDATDQTLPPPCPAMPEKPQ